MDNCARCLSRVRLSNSYTYNLRNDADSEHHVYYSGHSYSLLNFHYPFQELRPRSSKMIRLTALLDLEYVAHLLFWLNFHPDECIYLSAKGRGFGEPDGVAILQIIFLNQMFILDPYKHGLRLFQIASTEDPMYTLQHVLEDPRRLKIGFDVRSLSNYLYSSFGVKMTGILDLQVLSILQQSDIESPFLPSLRTAVLSTKSGPVPKAIRQAVCERTKRSKAFVDQKSGDSTPLYLRPLPRKVMLYCANDAILLPYLMKSYLSLALPAQEEALKLSNSRLLTSRQKDFVLNAPERRLKDDGKSQTTLTASGP